MNDQASHIKPHPEHEQIERSILLVRGQKIMLDADLAELYGASTKAFNQAVKRNGERFPLDFMFRRTAEEKSEVVTNCDDLRKLKFSKALPLAFTEHRAFGVVFEAIRRLMQPAPGPSRCRIGFSSSKELSS